MISRKHRVVEIVPYDSIPGRYGRSKRSMEVSGKAFVGLILRNSYITRKMNNAQVLRNSEATRKMK